MIGGLSFTFVVIPCLAAVAISALLRDWRLALAALSGALGLAFLTPYTPGGIGLIVLPALIGVILGALAMAIALPRNPGMDLWSRMLTALAVTFSATFLNLLLSTNGS